MNHILRSRKQKIEFLNGLRAGKNHVTEILPPGKYGVWFWIQEKGVYEQGSTEITEISEADYKAKLSKEFKEVIRLETLPKGDEMCLIERIQPDTVRTGAKPFSPDQVEDIIKALRQNRDIQSDS